MVPFGTQERVLAAVKLTDVEHLTASLVSGVSKVTRELLVLTVEPGVGYRGEDRVVLTGYTTTGYVVSQGQ
ncbi:hypothetical protein Pmani_014012 [Petrolisthes manimaculis]|uniref:Uncharacterized protein n=1 Tax=Petrolisthes manimaculis TaxID=1843537 RepID=A0AAE1PW72_9EUCA|nr:hypothetical protein Pmani_014012 [Petrolisthes manimaculis]